MDLQQLLDAFVTWLQGLFKPQGQAVPAAQIRADAGGLEALVRDALQREIIRPNGLPAAQAMRILYDQFKHETANGTAWYFAGAAQRDGKPPSYNLFNRHAGSGRGEWTGQTKYVSAGDQDIRIYTDVYQSARDYLQLLRDDGLYAAAWRALQRGDGAAYFANLSIKGFDAHGAGYRAMARRYGYAGDFRELVA